MLYQAGRIGTQSDVWHGRRALVTGAGGFVGSWLAWALLERGAEVTVIVRDQVPSSNFRHLGLADRVNYVQGSITDLGLVQRTLNEYEVDSCFHLAAQAIVGTANRSPLSTFESNIKGTWVVLDACRLSPGVDRVVVASSDKAYGTQSRLPYTEDMPLIATNPYDASKACADMLARSYQVGFGLPLAITRCANIYGGGDLNFSRLIPGTIRSALQGQRPIVRSDGTPIRDYLHVDDAVHAYLTLAEAVEEPDVRGQAFNFGTDRPISALDLVRLILELCGVPDLEPDIRGRGSLAGEIDRQYLDSSRAATRLGWEPQVEIRDGLLRTIAWYRDLVAPSGLSGPAAERLLAEEAMARK